MGSKKERLPRTVYWRPLSEPKTPPLCPLKRPQPETHPLPTAISEPLWYFCLEFSRILADTPAIYFLYHRQRVIKSPREDTGGFWEGTEWMEAKRKLFKAEHRLEHLLKCWLHISESAPASSSRVLSGSNGHLKGQSPRLNSQCHARAPAT